MDTPTVTSQKIPSAFILLTNQWIGSFPKTVPIRLRKSSIESYVTVQDGRTCVTMRSRDEWMVQETPELIDVLLFKKK